MSSDTDGHWMSGEEPKPFVPVTPAGTPCTWLAADSEQAAWAALLRDAAHMPYRGVEGFKQRGYTVLRVRRRP